jgi:hypothetical protein
MALTLRPTGLASPAYRDKADWIVLDDGREVGRIYEDPGTLPALRWFWSIIEYVHPSIECVHDGREPTLGQAKEKFRTNWEKACRLPSGKKPP